MTVDGKLTSHDSKTNPPRRRVHDSTEINPHLKIFLFWLWPQLPFANADVALGSRPTEQTKSGDIEFNYF